MADYSFIDLHIHTEFSHEAKCDDKIEDVFKDAEEIAKRSGKKCLLAISDHNTVLGVAEARKKLQSGNYKNIELISGAEFSTEIGELNTLFGGNTVFTRAHILAYGFDENNPELVQFSKDFHSGKRGFIKFSELAKMMKNAGGHLILAHPGLLKVYQGGLGAYTGTEFSNEIKTAGYSSKKTILRQMNKGKYILKVAYDKLEELSEGTLVGMERFHPDNYGRGLDNEIGKICEDKGLVQTSGSDFHGYHLHTMFSVGNPFTTTFQEFYKDTLKDCRNLKNGLHISHLPNIEFLTGESDKLEKYDEKDEIRLINGEGIPVSYEQYEIVKNALKEKLLQERPESSEKNNGSHSKNNGYGEHKHKKNSKKNHNNRSNKRRDNGYYDDFDKNGTKYTSPEDYYESSESYYEKIRNNDDNSNDYFRYKKDNKGNFTLREEEKEENQNNGFEK